jgi:hypothetical protein
MRNFNRVTRLKTMITGQFGGNNLQYERNLESLVNITVISYVLSMIYMRHGYNIPKYVGKVDVSSGIDISQCISMAYLLSLVIKLNFNDYNNNIICLHRISRPNHVCSESL